MQFFGEIGETLSLQDAIFYIKQSLLVVAILPNYLKSDSPVVKRTTFPAFLTPASTFLRCVAVTKFKVIFLKCCQISQNI